MSERRHDDDGKIPAGYQMPPADWRGYDIEEANKSLAPFFAMIIAGVLLSLCSLVAGCVWLYRWVL